MNRRIAMIAATFAYCVLGAGAAGAAEITLFEHAGFGGRAVTLRGTTPNFAEIGFNDMTSSIMVRDGTWEVCTDAGFRGRCATFRRGEYARLDQAFNNSISSARTIGGRDQPEYAPPPPPPSRGRGMARVVLSDGDDMRGRAVTISETVTNFEHIGFNDAAASMVIEGGYWEFCSDANFRGECRVFGPGRYARLEPPLYRSISSIRPAQPAAPARRAEHQGGDVVLFDDLNLGGRGFVVRGTVRNLNEFGFNDQASSLIVYAGRWEICTDAGFNGRCATFGPGRYDDLGDMDKQISSLRRVE